MSEYQYYEWLAIDRPLTSDEVEVVASLSSHMNTVTSTQAIVTYHWGDFKHDPKQVLLKYFDAALYYANWGSRRLMFRFPKGAIDTRQVEAYCVYDHITLTESGKFVVLDIDLSEEEGEWIEEDESLGQFVPLREQIIQGDYRVLYMAWLKAIAADPDDEAENDREPPVPAGLKKPTAALKAFMALFDIDDNLVRAAAAKSGDLKPVSDEALAGAISLLSRQECDAFLLRILNDERQVSSALRKRLMKLAKVTESSLGNAGIPSANILVPLKLSVAAQKSAGGFQHLNGDALNGAGLPKSISVCPIDEPSFQYYSHFIMKVKGAKTTSTAHGLDTCFR